MISSFNSELLKMITLEFDIGPAQAFIVITGSFGVQFFMLNFCARGLLALSGDQGRPITGCVTLSSDRISGT